MERAEVTELLRETACAEERGGITFLCDPNWSAEQRANARAVMSSVERRTPNTEGRTSNTAGGWLCVPTGGTNGGVRFARHDERTLGAAVNGFSRHFGLSQVNAVDVLPAHHVSGLMARVRCASSGGEHLAWDWKRLESGETPVVTGGPWVISLVPTQLQRLLGSRRTIAWLREFEVIFIGGGPVWPELAEAAASAQLRVSLSYGMTETAAMVAALRPDEFLAGARSCGAALPHASVNVNGGGAVRIAGESVFRGYWPEMRAVREFATEDLGRIDEHGHLHVLGRRDAMIITGGKKVSPAEVEAALRASGEFADVAVIGVPDTEWGEAVVACYPSGGRAPDLARALAALAGPLRPKRFVAVADWPRNAQGKVNRAELARLAAANSIE
jgi:O-succinylbenzoic acid--CoA ligase